MKARTAVRLLAFGLALVGIACGDDGPSEPPPEPVPGDMSVALISPNGDEGAALFETGDPGITAVSAVTGQVFFHQTGSTTRVIVILEVPGDIAFNISVEDLNDAPVLHLLDVADGENQLRGDLSSYQVEAQPITEVAP